MITDEKEQLKEDKELEDIIQASYDRAVKAKEVMTVIYDQDTTLPEELTTFHMKACICVERNDDYFCGLRADHFCVEMGYPEIFDGSEDVTVPPPCLIIVTANHKGGRMSTLFKCLGK